MDIYHVWCDLKPGVRDVDFTDAASRYLDQLTGANRLAGYRITRRKLGLASHTLGEFHLMLEFENLAQLDAAFNTVSTRSDPIESFHHAVNSRVQNVQFALYRDFPDRDRVRGQEQF
jgi:hypothetical protein